MGRRRMGGGGRSFRSRSSDGGLFSVRPRPAAASDSSRDTPKPAPAAPAPPPAPLRGGGSVLGEFVSNFFEGMALGTGFDIVHRAVDAVTGPWVVVHEIVASPAPATQSATMTPSNSLGGPDACSGSFKAFQDCLNTSGSEISKCQFYMDMLSECRKSSGATLSA